MILDYNYNKYKRNLSISYIKENGAKGVLNFNVNKFKSYYSTPSGHYENWDGSKCDIKWVDNPSQFDIRTFILELNSKYQDLINAKYIPKLYTFDIETEISDEFPEPSEAKFPITTISIANENCDVIILGTKEMTDEGYLKDSFNKYMDSCQFFKDLNMRTPKIQYIYFEKEEEMLKYFLQNIVAKVPVLAGWNSIMFDWQYIQNRIRGYYPDLSLNSASMSWTLMPKNYTDMRGEKVRLMMPSHTLILDMMDVIGNFDMVVMPVKESLSLDYIASESVGMNKIKYDGDLQKLFNEDYPKYVFYNAIDSVLVQLIDKKFKTLSNIYSQSLICKERIGSCFSKIALAEAMFFNYFYEEGIKVVPEEIHGRERGTLIGAYVREPSPGKRNWVCCNDFASLYPSTIITCNISIENYLGNINDHNEQEAEHFKNDKNYFVSVNGSIYKNDKDYAFKKIQLRLKNERNKSKYVAKLLKANVIADLDHIMSGGHPKEETYNADEIEKLKEIGYNVTCTKDIYKIEDKNEFKKKLSSEITYLTSYEQANKLVMNSLYGGSSHIAFFWYLMPLANDITGEGRNLIHLMEKHIPEYVDNNWKNMTEVHKELDIQLDPNASYKNLLVPIAGDTDSLYISYENLIKTIKGCDKMSLERLRDIIVGFNTGYLDKHNREFMENYYESRHVHSTHDFELETVAYSDVRLDVKKRYAQLLIWKDGYCPDVDKLIYKAKGLETTKSSYPKQARESLKRLIIYLLEHNDQYLLQQLNIEVQKEKKKWMEAPLEDICENKGVQNYTKYILNDNNKWGVQVAPKCPYNVRALGTYNNIRNINNLPGDPLYGGKLKIYQIKNNNHKAEEQFFAFQSRNYPKWAEQYAPIDKEVMFQKFLLDPFNRILNAIGYNKLNSDGYIQMSLF